MLCVYGNRSCSDELTGRPRTRHQMLRGPTRGTVRPGTWGSVGSTRTNAERDESAALVTFLVPCWSPSWSPARVAKGVEVKLGMGTADVRRERSRGAPRAHAPVFLLLVYFLSGPLLLALASLVKAKTASLFFFGLCNMQHTHTRIDSPHRDSLCDKSPHVLVHTRANM